MGFSKPKAVTQEPAPPPVTTTSADAARAADEERRRQAGRDGYTATMNPKAGRKTLLSAPAAAKAADAPTRKTLLSAS